MNLKEIESYWIDLSKDDLEAALVLLKKKKYTHSMFFLHLSVEKMLKALYVNKNKKEAPFGHNLQNLASKIEGVLIINKTMELLAEITTFNIISRYDDYKRNFYMTCDKKFSQKYKKDVEELLEWLRSQII